MLWSSVIGNLFGYSVVIMACPAKPLVMNVHFDADCIGLFCMCVWVYTYIHTEYTSRREELKIKIPSQMPKITKASSEDINPLKNNVLFKYTEVRSENRYILILCNKKQGY